MSNSSISSSKNIYKYIIRILLFVIFNIIVLLPIYMIGRKKAAVESIYSSVSLKHQLIEEANSPRIILAGASGTIFGYDSELLEELTGYRVINLGITLQTGLFFILSEIKQYAQPGDIVILAPEYHLFMKDQTDIRLIAELITYDHNVIFLVNQRIKVVVPMLKEIARVTGLGTGSLLANSITAAPFTLADITSNGDLVDHCHTGQLNFSDTWVDSMAFDEGFPESAFSGVNQVSQFCDSLDINFYLFFPAVTDSFFIKPEINSLASRMFDEIDISFLGNAELNVYEDSMFYNSIYHLNTNAAIVRTHILYELLKSKPCISLP